MWKEQFNIVLYLATCFLSLHEIYPWRMENLLKNPTEVPFWEIKARWKARTQIPSHSHYPSHWMLLEPVEEGSAFPFLWPLHSVPVCHLISSSKPTAHTACCLSAHHTSVCSLCLRGHFCSFSDWFFFNLTQDVYTERTQLSEQHKTKHVQWWRTATHPVCCQALVYIMSCLLPASPRGIKKISRKEPFLTCCHEKQLCLTLPSLLSCLWSPSWIRSHVKPFLSLFLFFFSFNKVPNNLSQFCNWFI